MNTKIVFAKILSFLTIFAMVTTMMTGFAASVRAQETDDTEQETQEVVETPTVENTEESDTDNIKEQSEEEPAPVIENEDTEDLQEETIIPEEIIPEEEKQEEDQEESSERSIAPFTVIVDEPQTATISATKILCPSEDLLPNWGDDSEGDPETITATTASNFIEENPECEIIDWNFEWREDVEGDENSNGEYALDNENSLEGWTSFDDTANVPSGKTIWVREQVEEGYTPFSGDVTSPYNDISAEFYCDNDVLNYDNYDYINTDPNTTYHCVAFNAHPDLCSNLEGIQTEIPKGMETDGDYCYTPEVSEEGICEEGDETYESVYVSDPTTLVGANPSAVLSFIHDAWTAVIGDAKWIWSTNPVALVPAVDEVETFTKTFEVTGTPTSASLEIAADNSYSVTLNGDALCSDTNENNFGATDNCPINVLDLNPGTNTLEFTVTNKDMADNLNPKINPAGLMYKLIINGDCETCNQTNGWMVDYFNYTHTDTGMNLPQSAWYAKSTYGNPLSLDNTFSTNPDAWTGWSYGADKYKFSQVESDLMFGDQNFFPFDSGTGLSHKNESLSWTYNPGDGTYTMHDNTPGGKDYHFGLHAKGYVNAPVAGSYAFTLSADDDVWIYVNGTLVVDNSGVHGIPGTVTGGNIALNAGSNTVELYYAERHVTQAGLDFQFTDENIKITTSPDCDTPPPTDMCLNLEGTQTMVPGGLIQNQDGNCVVPEEPLSCNPEINLLENGDFEAPALSLNSWSIITDSDSMLKWLVDWVSPEDNGTEGLEIQNNVAGAPFEGSQHAELDGDHPTTIYQNVPTVIGQAYDLNFAYSARPGVASGDNDITVKVNGNVLGAVLSDDGTGDVNTDWNTYTRTFVATSTNTKIEFTDTGADTSYGGYIDDVSLNCNPEPEIPMCEYNPEIPANSDDCVPPPPACEWNSEIPADSDDCVPPVETCPEGYYGIFPSCYPPIMTDACANIPEIQNEVPEGYTQDGENCYQEETTPTPQKHSSSGSRVSGEQGGEGEVLGASTDGVCEFNIDTYMRKGYKNNTEQVKIMQMLMNKYAGSTLSIDGLFGAMTEKAVKAFQTKYADEILKGAWGITSPTGIFFRSTLAKAKNLECPEVVTPIPVGLTNEYNWSKTPDEIVPAN